MKVIIAGSRGFSDYDFLCEICDKELSKFTEVEIISGGAKGADKLGERYAKERGFPLSHFCADWDYYGKSAGYKRYALMAVYADYLIAFWDGKSKGTRHMINLARRNNLEIKVYNFDI